MDWFMKNKHGLHSSSHDGNLAQVENKRWIDVDEPEKESSNGVSVRASQIKSITGGNTISAREIREKVRSFVPCAMLHFSTNYKINLPADDGGIQRRMITMTHRTKFVSNPDTYDKSQCMYSTRLLPKHDAVDKFTSDELLACFHILVESIADWNKVSINMEQVINLPNSIKNDGKEYLNSMDGMPAFLDKYLEKTNNDDDRVYIKDLHQLWDANKSGSKKYSLNGLKEYFIEKNIKVFKTHNVYSIKGYKINEGVTVEEFLSE